MEFIIIPFKPHWLDVKIRFKGLERELVKYIKPDNVIYDSHELLIAQLKSIKELKPYRLLVVDNDSMQKIVYGDYRDIVLEVRLLVEERTDGVYFKRNRNNEK